ncbi:MAG: hypothetical protein Q8O92_16230 [Candidatus Latescibacter sp.]|nr:hypothetical protein [Candidatus Latescibacter sp.]
MNNIWKGTTQCEYCKKELKNIMINGLTHSGHFAALCEKCADKNIINFFEKVGSIYKKNKEGLFEKLEWR